MYSSSWCTQGGPTISAVLWRVLVFQYTRHVFGAKDSPTCTKFALLKTAVDNETEYPEAALAVQQNFYLDDLLISVQSESEAFKLSIQLLPC